MMEEDNSRHIIVKSVIVFFRFGFPTTLLRPHLPQMLFYYSRFERKLGHQGYMPTSLLHPEKFL